MWMKTYYHMGGWAPGITLKEAIGNLEKSYSWLFFIYINFSFLFSWKCPKFPLDISSWNNHFTSFDSTHINPLWVNWAINIYFFFLLFVHKGIGTFRFKSKLWMNKTTLKCLSLYSLEKQLQILAPSADNLNSWSHNLNVWVRRVRGRYRHSQATSLKWLDSGNDITWLIPVVRVSVTVSHYNPTQSYSHLLDQTTQLTATADLEPLTAWKEITHFGVIIFPF